MIGSLFVNMVESIMGYEKEFLVGLLCINVLAFLMYGVDKQKAVKHKWRIPESTLLGIAFMGGALGAMCGMYVFRHKTSKKKFQTCVPLFFIIQAAILAIGMFCYISLNGGLL